MDRPLTPEESLWLEILKLEPELVPPAEAMRAKLTDAGFPMMVIERVVPMLLKARG